MGWPGMKWSSEISKLLFKGKWGVDKRQKLGVLFPILYRFTEANCEKFDVPRLLLQRNPGALHSYVDSRSDRWMFYEC